MKKMIRNNNSIFKIAQSLSGEITKEEPEVKEEEIKETKEMRESNRDGIISIFNPNDSTDRFTVIVEGKRYCGKFYNKDKNDFVSASMLAIYNLNEHFDRSILPEEYEGVIFNG